MTEMMVMGLLRLPRVTFSNQNYELYYIYWNYIWSYDLYNNIEDNIILNYHACGLDIIQSMIHRGRPPAWELIYFDDMNNFLINKKAQFLIDS